MVEVGVTATGLIIPPGGLLHKKDEAPPAVNVEEAPEHIEAGLAKVVMVGLGFTVTTTFAVPVQPEDAPVTEYIVVPVGETPTGLSVPSPLLHE